MDQSIRIRATALRVIDDGFPTWWEVALVDAVGREHRIHEKADVLTRRDECPGAFPFPLWLDSTTENHDGPIVRVTLFHRVETIEGLSVLHMARTDIE